MTKTIVIRKLDKNPIAKSVHPTQNTAKYN